MEDYSRDLEKELNKYSVPNPFKQARNWQLLFVSDDGKTIAVKRYKGLVISILAVLIIAILFSCGLTVLYYKSIVEKKSLRLAVEKASKELSRATEEKELLNARLFFEKKNDTKIVGATPGAAEVKKGENLPVAKKDAAQPVVEKISVGVEKLLITKSENSRYTRIKFFLRNLSKVKRISGYVYVVLKPDAEQQKGWLTLPPVLLKDGEPSVPKRGRFFAINHFKTMNFKFKDNSDAGYQNITIYVYLKADENLKVGGKIFESTYPVNIKIVKKPVAPKQKVAKPEKKGGNPPEKATSIDVKRPGVGKTSAAASTKTASEKIDSRRKIEKSEPAVKVEKTGSAGAEKTESAKGVNVEGALENAE